MSAAAAPAEQKLPATGGTGAAAAGAEGRTRPRRRQQGQRRQGGWRTRPRRGAQGLAAAATAAPGGAVGQAAGPEVGEEEADPAAAEARGEMQYFVGTSGFMGLSPRKYAASLSAVELNFTFHDQTEATYEDQAAQFAALGLHVIVKVSNYATHVDGLQTPRELWPWLKAKYRAFADAGILVALLWQLPPSFDRTGPNLDCIGRLGAQLRNPRQGARWQRLQHAFEFRHSSWFNDEAVAETLHRHRLTAVRCHVQNDAAWAGDLESGWHGVSGPLGQQGEEPSDFVYLRCTGTVGRSVGRYSAADLLGMIEQVKHARTAVVIFGQGDVPSEALDNARELRRALEDDEPLSAEEPEATKEVVSGTVVAVTRGWNRRVVLDVDGRRGYLGFRHLQKKGLNLTVGSKLDDLTVEADDGSWLALSAPTLAAAQGGA